MLAELAMAASLVTVGCPQQSFGTFPTIDRKASVVRGPLVLGGWRSLNIVDQQYFDDVHGSFKTAILLRPGHTATIRVTGGKVRYGGRPLATRYRFRACADQPGSTANGRPIVFWPGRLRTTRFPACIRVRIRIDGRHVDDARVPIGPNACRA